MSEKFDYFVCMMLAGKNFQVEDVRPHDEIEKEAKEAAKKAGIKKKMNVQSPKFGEREGGFLKEAELESKLERFREFTRNAKVANLGEGSSDNQDQKVNLMKMGSGWL